MGTAEPQVATSAASSPEAQMIDGFQLVIEALKLNRPALLVARLKPTMAPRASGSQ